ncbi:MAG: hypothetical protein ACLQVY_08710, partial [Limisphaerales bacterium]
PGSATVSVAVVGVSPTTCFQSYTIPIEAFRCRANIRRGFGVVIDGVFNHSGTQFFPSVD